jgi:acyl-CoA synthetase (AMP-forming)/AMP-acid ligase II
MVPNARVDMTLDPLWRRGGSGIALLEPGGDDQLTYDELAVLVERLARQLVGSGVAPGDVVAFALPNGPEIVALFLAVTAARATAAPLNPAYQRSEVTRYLQDLHPRVAVLLEDEPGDAHEACSDLGIPTLLLGRGAASSLALAGAQLGEMPAAAPDDVALLLHTSGTTSKPKSVPIRQRNLAASTASIARCYRLGPEDVTQCAMPLFHVHGLVATALATLQSGGTVVLPRRFVASRFWTYGARYGMTWFTAVPTIHQVLCGREGDRPSERLRFARSCSAALSPQLLKRFESRFGVALVEAYGMTEATHQMATNPLPPRPHLPGSVGVAAGTEIAIVDDGWRPLPAGVSGEIVVRGPGVVDGYLDNPAATAASFLDGWFRTGDSGTLDADGYLRLDGRLKELINRGGEKISPYEVEDVLLRHEHVSEAVAFALPDEKFGEAVGAMVVAVGTDERSLRSHCAEHLAGFKVPARIAVAPEIPKSATGKVQRRLLAAELQR